jgi:hypothetical protein
LPCLVHVDEASAQVLENRGGMRRSGDQNGRLAVHQALAEKPCDGRVEARFITVELHGVMVDGRA